MCVLSLTISLPAISQTAEHRLLALMLFVGRKPVDEGGPLHKLAARKLLGMLEVTASVVLATSGVVAATSTWQHVDRGVP